MGEFTTDPKIWHDGIDVFIVSRIRYRLSQASEQLAQRLLDNHAMHRYDEPESRQQLVVWPLSTETAVMELTDRAKHDDRPALEIAHRIMARAHAEGLHEIAGFAEIVSPSRFGDIDPVR